MLVYNHCGSVYEKQRQRNAWAALIAMISYSYSARLGQASVYEPWGLAPKLIWNHCSRAYP